ncbi:Tubulin polyglutamylase TTLL5 [Hondaea fermentalgiana]|uniref:Tubulin--tyrosine ligase-like protein 9 n=1 Tax=Hondaea fermentalgiana TaxID=2315210 RepID=A0A2R5GDK3_9STRA|nr:Tubulin polyglutamylase TTLL5 [Hondaea fermentalgiana]|eukprot:GBG28389.1 Tubulin polyglutamylase TTLL5 [Hondaea fermentalgiana]
MVKRGWKETDSDMDWDIHWSDRDWIIDHFDNAHFETWQRVNHYRNDRELCRKDLLIKNLKRQKRQLERDGSAEADAYEFFPDTFVLPREYAIFVETFKKAGATTATWIMKPIGKSQGRGIFLFRNLNDIRKWKSETRWKADNADVESYIVQRYICNPYLVGGKKFDLRIYALVTSFTPLKVYLHRSGFARFSNSRYSSLASDMANQYVHLTNVAVQKSADNYNKATGGKWGLRDLKLYLMSRHGVERTNQVFADIEDIVLRSLQSVQKVMIHDKHCFELYGYDIMIDDQLKPWLIEVNASPSLAANTDEDFSLKFRLLNDMFDIVDMEGRRTGEEMRIGGFDLMFDAANEGRGRKRRVEAGYVSTLGSETP